MTWEAWCFRTIVYGQTPRIAAAQSGRRVYYGALAYLITSLEEAKAADRLSVTASRP